MYLFNTTRWWESWPCLPSEELSLPQNNTWRERLEIGKRNAREWVCTGGISTDFYGLVSHDCTFPTWGSLQGCNFQIMPQADCFYANLSINTTAEDTNTGWPHKGQKIWKHHFQLLTSTLGPGSELGSVAQWMQEVLNKCPLRCMEIDAAYTVYKAWKAAPSTQMTFQRRCSRNRLSFSPIPNTGWWINMQFSWQNHYFATCLYFLKYERDCSKLLAS